MKVRVGFVSNSSSSSFLIAFKESDVCEHCGRSDPSIKEIFNNKFEYESMWSDASYICAYGREDTIDKLKERYSIGKEDSYGSRDSMTARFIKALDKIIDRCNNGMNVAFVQVNYHDGLEKRIRESDSIEILQEEY